MGSIGRSAVGLTLAAATTWASVFGPPAAQPWRGTLPEPPSPTPPPPGPEEASGPGSTAEEAPAGSDQGQEEDSGYSWLGWIWWQIDVASWLFLPASSVWATFTSHGGLVGVVGQALVGTHWKAVAAGFMSVVGCMALYYGGTGLLACIQAIELVCCLRSCPCRRRDAGAPAPTVPRQGGLPELGN